MEVNQLKRSFLEYAGLLFREGFLDGQFSQLQLLQDETNPDFVVEVVSLFFDDSDRLLNELFAALDEHSVDFKKLDAHVHQFKGSSASIGALRVKNSCIAFRNLCAEQNAEGCLKCLKHINQEYMLLKTKLQGLFRLKQQIVAVGGTIPILSVFV
ncbi:Histidine-containing phosphotransfer protein 1 [Striga hermonthica]|uniref:Histidine-containing phosphotransfer protein n=1 Tax=Striga hermonthica TaxID=68872 RepID=A0A9N7NSW1_STRHE|nr:Histidine-containing phosphotransfer protein 1 [Striga hermonthica]